MTETRKCNKHGDLPLSKWTRYLREGKYVKYSCKLCVRERSKKYAKENSEYYASQRVKYRDKINANRRKQDATRRLNVLRHYSGSEIPFCACCADSHLEFLALDHIFGGGSQHRKEVGGASNSVYRWVEKNNFPPMFRVLCHNCNMATAIYGVCPHQKEKENPCDPSTSCSSAPLQ